MALKLKPIGSNMTEVCTDKAVVLFSYRTPVACMMQDGGGFYRTSKKWSVTTSRHINKWLEGAKAEERDQTFFDSLV